MDLTILFVLMAIMSFLLGAFTGIYFLRLGMVWAAKARPPDQGALDGPKMEDLPIFPELKKESGSEERPQPDLLKEWFNGGDKS